MPVLPISHGIPEGRAREKSAGELPGFVRVTVSHIDASTGWKRRVRGRRGGREGRSQGQGGRRERIERKEGLGEGEGK
jgi:hypothetical protein